VQHGDKEPSKKQSQLGGFSGVDYGAHGFARVLQIIVFVQL
jgi:hypothetical protein